MQGYEALAGNKSGIATVEEVVELVEKLHEKANRILVMDRGVVSESNVSSLKEGNRRYIVGTPKSQLRAVEQQLRTRDGLDDEPRKVFDETEHVHLVDVILPTRHGIEIRRRCITQPTKHQTILLGKLKLHLPRQLSMHEM